MSNHALDHLLILLALVVGTIFAGTIYSAFSNDLPLDRTQYQPERAAP